jgi:hypothetical protein
MFLMQIGCFWDCFWRFFFVCYFVNTVMGTVFFFVPCLWYFFDPAGTSPRSRARASTLRRSRISAKGKTRTNVATHWRLCLAERNKKWFKKKEQQQQQQQARTQFGFSFKYSVFFASIRFFLQVFAWLSTRFLSESVVVANSIGPKGTIRETHQNEREGIRTC